MYNRIRNTVDSPSGDPEIEPELANETAETTGWRGAITDVFLLQEHWLTPANLCYFSNFSSEYFYFGSSATSKCVEEGMLRGRPYGDVVMLISNKLRQFWD